MRVSKLISPLITLSVVAGLGFAGYHYREPLKKILFPEQKKPGASTEAAPHAEGDGHDHSGHSHDHASQDRVKLTPQAQKNLGLDVDAIMPEVFWRKTEIPGMVVDRPGETDRGVTSRVSGIVREIKARPGDTVKAGDTLFTIQLVSEFLQSTQSELLKATKEQQYAEAKRDKTAAFVKGGTKSQLELIEDENQVKRFATQVQSLRKQLLTFGLSPEQMDRIEKGEVITEMEVKAPGKSPVFVAKESSSVIPVTQNDVPLFEVQELKVQLGEQVQAGQTLCTLSNHQSLFIEGRAFKGEAKLLAAAAKEKWPIEALFADEKPGEWPALEPIFIRHLANSVDADSRTFAFYLPLKNQSETYDRDGEKFFVWRFRPGQRVKLKIPVEKLGDEVFVLPAGAVVREGGEAYVFRQNGDNFDRKPVHVLYEDRTVAVLADDGSIGAGQFIVRNQAAALNRAIKANAGGGGAHEGHDHAGHSH